MKKLATAICILISCCAFAQKAPKAWQLGAFCDTLSVRLQERTGVKSKLSVYKVVPAGGSLDLYFGRTISDYPWHREDQKWFRETAAAELRTVTKDFSLGNIKARHFEFEELILPHITNDGTPSPYTRRCQDPKGRTQPLVSRLGARKYPRGMDGRFIALWYGHGRYYNEKDSCWMWQRAPLHRTMEDLYTESYVLQYLAPMLENAGANVIFPRERDYQWREFIIDNDPTFDGPREGSMRHSGEYAEKGAWKDAGCGFADIKPEYTFNDMPFRNGTARVSECNGSSPSASVSWTPEIEERGEYAVYVSYKTLPSSTTEAHYTVRHMGGISEFNVNQTIGGGTWIYLGTFEFDKGDKGCVTLDNRGNSQRVVTADAVKIGGGVGKLERGGSTSGVPCFAEGSHYWLQWAGADTTVTKAWPTDYTNDFADKGVWAEMMKKDKGIPFDLSLAFHSDAGLHQKDSIVGTLAIYSYMREGSKKFEDGRSRMISRLLAGFVQDQVVSDIREDFEPEWTRRELWDRSYSESRTTGVPGMILELLSHQNFADMKYGLDPDFRFEASRAVYKGILKTLGTLYGTKYTVQPLPVKDMALRFSGEGKALLSWRPTTDDKEPTAVPTGYVVYTRVDGGVFSSGFEVSGTTAEFDIEPGRIYSFRVAAYNDGGLSFPSEILSIGIPSDGGKGKVLVVNNFDRVSAPDWVNWPGYSGFDGTLDSGVPYVKEYLFIGENYDFDPASEYVSDDQPGFGASRTDHTTEKVAGNSFDYPYVHGKALMDLGYAFYSMSRDAFCEGRESGCILDLVCGKQKTTKKGRGAVPAKYQVFPEKLKLAISRFAGAGGNIIISGANIASDEREAGFTESILGYGCVTSMGTTAGRIGEWEFHNRMNPYSYCVECPDGLRDAGPDSKVLLKYPVTEIPAAVLYKADNYRAVSIGVPIEAFKCGKDRKELLRMSLQALQAN